VAPSAQQRPFTGAPARAAWALEAHYVMAF